MRILALSLCVAAAGGCTDGGGDDDYQILPGGTEPGTQEPDTLVRGRVCVATDLRDLGSCATSGAGGLTVGLGDETTVTEANGRFELPRPAVTTGMDFSVRGEGVIQTYNPFAPSASTVLTAIDADVYARELASTGVALPAGSGAILGTVSRADGAATGIGLTTSPAAPFGPFYDGIDAFTLDSTGARGVFFVPGLTAGATNLAFRNLGSSNETLVNGIMVRNGGITILDSVALP